MAFSENLNFMLFIKNQKRNPFCQYCVFGIFEGKFMGFEMKKIGKIFCALLEQHCICLAILTATLYTLYILI